MKRFTAFNNSTGMQQYFDNIKDAFQWSCENIYGFVNMTLEEVEIEMKKIGRAVIINEEHEIEDVVIADTTKNKVDENGFIEW